MKNDNQLEIYTVPKYEGNAYIMETIGDYYDTLWTAPLFKNETVDNSQWSIVEDEQMINDVLDSSERTIIDEITVKKFVSYKDQKNSDNQNIFLQEEKQ